MSINIKPFVSLKSILSPESVKTELPSYLNLWAVEDGILVGADTQMSLCYEIQGIDLLLKPDNELNMFYNSVKTALNVLPENVTVQFVVQVRRGNDELINRYKSELDLADDISKYLAEVKTEFFRKSRPYRKRYLMFFTVHPDNENIQNLKPSLMKLYYPDYKKLAKSFHEKFSRQLKESAGVFVKSLTHAGIKAKQLNEEEIIKFLYEHLNPGRAEHLDIKGLNREHTLRSQLVYNAGENLFSQYSCDGYHYRGVNLYVRPEDISFTYLPNLIGKVDDEYDIVLTTHKVNKEKAFTGVSGLEMQRTITSLTNFNRNDVNYGATQKVGHITEFIKMIEESKESVFELSFCVVLRDTDLMKLKSRTDNCLAGFKDISDAEGIIDDMNHFQLYLSVMPNHSMYNPRRHIMHASAAAMFLPLFQYWQGCKSPKILYFTRQNELLPIDINERELIQSSNMLVFGSTGSGKSFSVNTLIEAYYMSSSLNHVIIIDVGDSYKNMCNILGGQYFAIGFTDEYGLNPFPPKDIAYIADSNGNYEMDPDWLSYLSLLIRTFLSKPEFTGQESLILERAITNTYKHLKPEYDTPILSNLHYQLARYTPAGVSEGSEEAQDKEASAAERRIAKQFASNIEVYTQGTYGKLLNRRTNINIDARFTVFELQGLREHETLRKIVIFIIRNLLWKKLYDKSIRKLICMDECWSMMNDPVSAQLIAEMYRVVRKFNGAVLAITQNVADINKSMVADAIKINTPIKFFLRMTDGIEHLSNWELSPQEVEYIRGLKTMIPDYSEIALKYGDKFRVLRLSVSRPEYFVCTSDPNDYNKGQALRKKHPDATALDIIKKLAAGEGV